MANSKVATDLYFFFTARAIIYEACDTRAYAQRRKENITNIKAYT
jgi:hypothetical protein